MMSRKGPALAALLTTIAAAAAYGVVTTSAASAAAATPPYEPDPNAAGTITFYDAAGNVKTGGTITDDPFAAYAVGSAPLTATGSKASLFGYLPKSGQATGAFSGEVMSGPTTFPVTSAPSPVKESTNPAVKLVSGDVTLAQLQADFPNTATDAYQGLYQLRIKTTDVKYEVADIQISGTTWSQVYPAPAAPPPSPSATASPTPSATASPTPPATASPTSSPAASPTASPTASSTTTGPSSATEGDYALYAVPVSSTVHRGALVYTRGTTYRVGQPVSGVTLGFYTKRASQPSFQIRAARVTDATGSAHVATRAIETFRYFYNLTLSPSSRVQSRIAELIVR